MNDNPLTKCMLIFLLLCMMLFHRKQTCSFISSFRVLLDQLPFSLDSSVQPVTLPSVRGGSFSGSVLGHLGDIRIKIAPASPGRVPAHSPRSPSLLPHLHMLLACPVDVGPFSFLPVPCPAFTLPLCVLNQFWIRLRFFHSKI